MIASVAGEILIADNGSTDGSRELALEHGCRVIEVAERGYGNALLNGIREAKGKWVIMGDADDSYDLYHLDGFLEMLRAGYDLVMGNRFRGGISPGAMPFLHRYLGNPILTGIGRLFFRQHHRRLPLRLEGIPPGGDPRFGPADNRDGVCLRDGRQGDLVWVENYRGAYDAFSSRADTSHPTCAPGKMAGDICDSCCFTAHAGCFSTRDLIMMILGFAATLALLPGPISLGGRRLRHSLRCCTVPWASS